MKGMRFADHSVINSAPLVEEDQVILRDGSAFRGRFTFAIGEDEAGIQMRLGSPSPRK
jgi:hypothetical protein